MWFCWSATAGNVGSRFFLILQGQKLGPVLKSAWSWLGFVDFVMTGKGMQGKAREVNKFFEEWPRQGEWFCYVAAMDFLKCKATSKGEFLECCIQCGLCCFS